MVSSKFVESCTYCLIVPFISGLGTWTFKHKRDSHWRTRALSFIRPSRRLWCYLLHAIFILLHLVLLDVSQAWTSMGSALFGVWQQTKVTASLAVTSYYLCISILHVPSTAVMQFQVFSSSKNNAVQSTLAWPSASAFSNTTYDWTGLSTNGLVDSTVYDTPLVSVNATVNATIIHADCGMLSNLFLGSDLSLNATVPIVGLVTIFPVPTICESFGELFHLGDQALTWLQGKIGSCV